MKIQIPSKTFLWGEYSALIGGSAGILTGRPFFEFKSVENSSNTNLFHPDSPAGIYLNKIKDRRIIIFDFLDPHEFKGGFGRSTAEYIAALFLSGVSSLGPENISKAWQEYRDLNGFNSNPPSGYDLIAQAANTLSTGIESEDFKNYSDRTEFKITLVDIESNLNETALAKNGSYEIKPTQRNSKIPIWSENSDLLKKIGIMVFKTPLKIKTHDHLNELDFNQLGPLKKLSNDVSQTVIKTISDSSSSLYLSSFFKSLMSFDQELEKLNLVHRDSKNVCDKIKQIESVFYARGCGALGADVIAVFYDLTLYKTAQLDLRHKILKSSELIFIADTNGID